MADAKYQLTSRITRLSQADEWESARKEWQLDRIYKTEKPMSCLCGHTPISNVCVLKNTVNRRTASVGNCCVKKFMGLPSDTIFNAVNRVSKDDNKSANIQTLKLALEKKLITQWEHDFYVDTMNKRKLTAKQKTTRKRVNQKLARLTKNMDEQ
ncbi:hypothetical protein JQ760_027800 (plasmid) [Klebsiella pneumoniae]|uniref:hypothetical protein n=1 Tax=Klebsiella pneumoniae TaxID=573 RepID=UPI001FAE4CA0|nr:hypothetical protein [Klebsiella pneumoniae]MCI8109168.1 hypothetical protein [Klebsiella pneumoniae]